MRTCSVEGCEGKHYSREYCYMHYFRWWRKRDPNLVLIRGKGIRECIVPGCKKEHCAKEYCSMHYRRFKRHGDPLLGGRKLPKNIEKCSAEGCERNQRSKGFCTRHYQNDRNRKMRESRLNETP